MLKESWNLISKFERERERERERDYLMVVMWKIEWLILTIYYVGERLMKNEISSLYKNWLLMIIQYTYIILFLLNNLGFQMSWNISIISQFWRAFFLSFFWSEGIHIFLYFLLKKIIINFKILGCIFNWALGNSLCGLA